MWLLAGLFASTLTGAPQNDTPQPELLFGGCGGVYFLAEPGELEVEVFKRDTNRRGRHTELRAILVGPDRRVRQEVAIPDDGLARGKGLGPLLSAKLSTRVERKGLFALNITVSQDRYGEEMVWGFRTNCPNYVIETARGHKDERHREPIVLAGDDGPATVCFGPRRREFEVGVTGLPESAATVQVVDADGELIREAAVQRGGVSMKLPGSTSGTIEPWCLKLPSARATITIDGVTQWDASDPGQDCCVWTPEPSSWFPLLDHRWLLTPYQRTVYGEPGSEQEITFQVHNNGAAEKSVHLSLEFAGASWPAQLSSELVRLAPGSTAPVTVAVDVLPEDGTVHLRATPEDASGFSTWSTLTVRAGPPPALEAPLQLEPYRHENAQFGYLPRYPTTTQPYFDLENRPCLVDGSRLATLRDDAWITTRLPGSSLTTKVAFDQDNGIYVVARSGEGASLLHSPDGGGTFGSYSIPGGGKSFDIEQFSGHNVPEGPPSLVRFTRTAKDPKLLWRSLNDLELFTPRKVAGRIEVGEPILLSRACIGMSSHSGTPSSIVSRGSKVHVAWGEATDPKEKVPGVPTYVVTFDRVTGQLGEPALIGHGPPANDVHNSPSITIDSEGFLHVLIGTHGRPFQYVKSKRSNDAGSGWTAPVTAGADLRPTYIGLVCGPDDTLYTVFRLWRSGEPYPHSHHATLAMQRKRPDGPWEPPRILVVAPFSEYSIFYHRLTIDRKGQLFLSKDYWSTYWFYRNDQRGKRGHWRTLLLSPDGGETWRLAADEDFL